ncbi:MAG: hypothetical protein MJ141_05925 [Clostridia bacterium]|nr:hypothetical protein [Clostridia bacterium]
MSAWKEIRTESDIDEIMETLCDFHDSCIVSLSYKSGAFVDEERAMHFGSLEDREISVIFHSQWDPKVFELCFTGVRRMHLVGWQDHYFCDIQSAGLSFCNDILPGIKGRLIVWTDYDSFTPSRLEDPLNEFTNTYIISDSLKWRIIE